jgi:DNA-directed RNA polymerase sigma subunit (sigma70/sigma32)
MRQPCIVFSIYDPAPDSAVAAARVATYQAACRQRCVTQPLDVPSTQLLAKETHNDIIRLLEPLGRKERDMVSRHCGMSGAPESYAEIATTYRVSRQRVHEIIRAAINKIRRTTKRSIREHET